MASAKLLRGTDVPTKRTPLDVDAVSAALVVAFSQAGRPLTRESACLFLAQIWLETARGVSCYNYNVGNLTPARSYAGPIRRPEWYSQETIDAVQDPDRRARLQDLHDRMGTDVPSSFRAYASLEEGVKDYAQLFTVESASRYRKLLDIAEQGDPRAFAAEIKASGYAPDLPSQAAETIQIFFDVFQREGRFASLPSRIATTRPVPTQPAPASSPPSLQITPNEAGISVFIPFTLIAAAFLSWHGGRSGR